MPRIYSRCSDPYDYCLKCFPKTEEAARKKHGHDGDGPDGRGDCFTYDSDHPPYDDGEDYKCTKCRKLLKGIDDYLPDPPPTFDEAVGKMLLTPFRNTAQNRLKGKW